MTRRSTSLFFLMSFAVALGASADDDIPKLFVVHFQTGPAWDTSLAPADQSSFREHSENMKRLRASGIIRFGARYDDLGMIIIEADDLEQARALMAEDPGVQSGLFVFTVARLNVFFPWDE